MSGKALRWTYSKAPQYDVPAAIADRFSGREVVSSTKKARSDPCRRPPDERGGTRWPGTADPDTSRPTFAAVVLISTRCIVVDVYCRVSDVHRRDGGRSASRVRGSGRCAVVTDRGRFPRGTPAARPESPTPAGAPVRADRLARAGRSRSRHLAACRDEDDRAKVGREFRITVPGHRVPPFVWRSPARVAPRFLRRRGPTFSPEKRSAMAAWTSYCGAFEYVQRSALPLIVAPKRYRPSTTPLRPTRDGRLAGQVSRRRGSAGTPVRGHENPPSTSCSWRHPGRKLVRPSGASPPGQR